VFWIEEGHMAQSGPHLRLRESIAVVAHDVDELQPIAGSRTGIEEISI
jgi:hypothetical protein